MLQYRLHNMDKEDMSEVMDPQDSTESTSGCVTQNVASDKHSFSEYWKKAGCAITGGAITAVGLVMIPAPTPCGCVVTAYGLSVLGREFEGAQRIVDVSKHTLEGGLESWAKDWGRDQEDETEDTQKQTEQDCEIQNGSGDHIERQKQDEYSRIPNENGVSSNVGKEETVHTNETEKCQQQEGPLLEKQTDTKGSTLAEWGKTWKCHSTNFRKGTSSFITKTILPALRNLDLNQSKDNNSSVIESAKMTEINIGDSEVIKASQDEILMIEEHIKEVQAGPSSRPAFAADSSTVPDSAESAVSDTESSLDEDETMETSTEAEAKKL